MSLSHVFRDQSFRTDSVACNVVSHSSVDNDNDEFQQLHILAEVAVARLQEMEAEKAKNDA